MKDTLERATEPNLNVKAYLQNTYIHPVFKEDEDSDDDDHVSEKLQELENILVPTKRTSRRNTPLPSISQYSPPSSPTR